jgi:hypothetical protein
LPLSVAKALRLVAAGWRRLQLAAKEGVPWMEATPALQMAMGFWQIALYAVRHKRESNRQ